MLRVIKAADVTRNRRDTLYITYAMPQRRAPSPPYPPGVATHAVVVVGLKQTSSPDEAVRGRRLERGGSCSLMVQLFV